MRNDLAGGFERELTAQIYGIHRLRRNRAFIEDVWKEMFGGLEQSVTGNADDYRFARIAEKWKEIARQRANDAGASIAKLPGHVITQAHNTMKLLKAGVDQWKRDILPGLDIERTFGTADPSRFLDIVYVNRTTGTRAEGDAHLGAAPRDGKPHLRGHAPGLGMKLVRQSFSRE